MVTFSKEPERPPVFLTHNMDFKIRLKDLYQDYNFSSAINWLGEPGIAVSFSPRTLEAEAGQSLGVQRQPSLHSGFQASQRGTW